MQREDCLYVLQKIINIESSEMLKEIHTKHLGI